MIVGARTVAVEHPGKQLRYITRPHNWLLDGNWPRTIVNPVADPEIEKHQKQAEDLSAAQYERMFADAATVHRAPLLSF